MTDTYEILRDYMIKPKGMFIWRDIPEWEGRYQISNHGEVCSVKNKILEGVNILFTRPDKSRQNLSRRILFKTYWPKEEQNEGHEKWKKIDYFGEYYISNYADVKNCKRLILWPTKDGRVTLMKKVEGKMMRVNVSVLKLFLNTFPPYEVEVNLENKTINWKKI